MTLQLPTFDILICCIFTVYYITNVFLLDGNGGPFLDTKKVVILSETESRFVGLWDKVRSYFGLYNIVYKENRTEEWYVNPQLEGLFTCTLCLSFWVSLITCLFYAILFRDYTILFFILPSAGIVTYLDS